MGLGVYIWNVSLVKQLVRILRRVSPDLCLVWWTEVGYERQSQVWLNDGDYVVCGEGEQAFTALCRRGRREAQAKDPARGNPSHVRACDALSFVYG